MRNDFNDILTAPFHKAEHPSKTPVCHDFETVEAMLIEAWLLWRRSPGGGRWPFASDGPWDQISRASDAGDYEGRMIGEEIAEPRSLPLSRAEVSQRDRVSQWLSLIEDEQARRLVCLVVGVKALERDVRWPALLHPLGLRRGAGRLERRYNRAIAGLCVVLNQGEGA